MSNKEVVKSYMKGYKAFDHGMTCDPTGKNPYQFKENTVFEQNEDAVLYERGFHFCKNPLDVLKHYPLVNDKGEITEFAEVEALDNPVNDGGDKYCTKKIKIGAKLTFPALVQASVDFEMKSGKVKKCDKDDEKIKSSGDYAQIGSSGDYAQIGSSGRSARIGSSGDYAQIGSSGDSARIGSSGDSAQIGSSGDSAQIGSSGDSARIGSSGRSARIGSSGYYARIGSSGKNCVICCAGSNSKVKAKKGSWITLSEWEWIDDEYTPVCVKTEKVDGERIKEDTFYSLKNGEFCEVKE